MTVDGLIAVIINLNSNSEIVHKGFFLVTVANLIIVILMVVVFLLAIFIPFPHHKIVNSDTKDETEKT